MRATIHNYLEAAKARREENGEKGFSLIELIIVVVILGILVAIAIPIFSNIQAQAQLNALNAAAANGATAAAAAFADTPASPTPTEAAASAGSNGITTALVTSAGNSTDVSNVCVSATDGTTTRYAGPGAAAGGASC
ncbi:prepilin-type N-terminal cleavage/methylation domain-containing protein [Microbacterium sp. BK668]|uniref:type IV pilin protein n=1 Tax=Microbacterium sp. BK668 TaxID=2512118 RepID=UPI0010D298A4|nr:prepilin-type N-terminal cleavage/methylation domain-containing protein [Microbacterium sp. BK668]TDN93236.1 prepilin-type N-terminal cleavage/methylation domain-containing protein [Microbacterium sp. BK668]